MLESPEKSRPKSGLVVWRLTDGKPGHEAQTLGLVKALQQRITVTTFELSVRGGWADFKGWLIGTYSSGRDLPAPDLIIGAGHRTHWSLLAAKRACGGKTVVLMKPSVPSQLFDLCVVPEHDRVGVSSNILITTGVLNPIQPALQASPEKGLFLIGGPSKHHGWNTDELLRQIDAVLQAEVSVQWTLTTSRRTPADCTERLCKLKYENLKVVPVEETPRGWVAEQLSQRAKVWATEDSVSMIYEALTAGASLGLLAVPVKRSDSRVVRAVEVLVEAERAAPFEKTSPRGCLPVPVAASTLQEAKRCAEYIVSTLIQKEGS